MHVPIKQSPLALAIIMTAQLLFTGVAYSAEAPVNDCDRLAAHPDDIERADVPGLMFEDIDRAAAVEACTAAVKAHPGVNRFLYQLGRAHHARDGLDAAVPFYESAAEAGHVLSSFVLYWTHAEIFEQSRGTDEESRRKAVKWLQHGAEVLQDPDMRAELGIALLNGELLPMDVETAIRLIREQAADNHPTAQYFLGLLILETEDDNSFDIAFEWLEMASVNGSEDATGFLRSVYADLSTFGELPRPTAEEIEATLAQGRRLIRTYGRTAEDLVSYMTRAAEADYDWANFMMGIYHQEGEFVPKDLAKARAYLERAVELGSDPAQFALQMLDEKSEQP